MPNRTSALHVAEFKSNDHKAFHAEVKSYNNDVLRAWKKVLGTSTRQPSTANSYLTNLTIPELVELRRNIHWLATTYVPTKMENGMKVLNSIQAHYKAVSQLQGRV